ncbi:MULTISPECIES: hypothetical protein [unclassified Fusibacter]|uniref:hypothetical protein n=1 Tax=unclassified Fusibacter TaxID=2624464 RepID=UPI001011F405|nr:MULTISPECIES: hypothetical protein [unclassified Fusibacter]MCK8060372.1 hypothetical protein [Fusibacter sp. A2]NPE20339.1 hypothetical protein [Fusibacter sp. A1]RXV63545.1 hypothetical protein DWB64_00805 [Fusibacter sp. A1]
MDQGITTFVDDVLRQVINTGAHDAIRDELIDHYATTAEAYLDCGDSEYEANRKALASLGDGKSIGKQLNNVWFPQLKWTIQWCVVTLVILLLYSYLFINETSLFSKASFLMIFVAMGIDILSQSCTLKYIYSYYKQVELPFVRIYPLKKTQKNSISYIEKLTNRLAVVFGVFFGVLMIASTVSLAFETETLLAADRLTSLALPLIFYKVFFLTFKMMKSPIVVMDHRGVWIQGATIPYLKWSSIKELKFYTNYKKQYVCEFIRFNHKGRVTMPCLPLDQESIIHLFECYSQKQVSTSP